MFTNSKLVKKITLYLLCTVLICFWITKMILNSSGFEPNNLFNGFDSNFNIGEHWNGFNYKYNYDVNEEKSIEPSNINSIKIDMVSADIKVLISEDDNIKATLKGYVKSSEEASNPKLDMTSKEGTLYITSQNNAFKAFSSYSMDLKLEIFIPKSYINDLYIKSTSSDIFINTLNLNSLNIITTSGFMEAEEIIVKNFNFTSTSGDLDINKLNSTQNEIQTASGNIEVKSIEGNSSISSTSGDLNIDRLSSNQNQIRTTSGNIEIHSIEGGLTLNSTSGDSYLKYSKMPSGNIDINSISGNLELLTPSNAEYFIDASSTSGNITLNKPILAEVKKEHQIKGVVGSDNCKINIKTTSGDVDIK